MDTRLAPRCFRSDEPADPPGPRIGGSGSGQFSRGGTEGTWVAYTPITALGDLMMLSLAPGLGPYKLLFICESP